jgi:hypothetical protein
MVYNSYHGTALVVESNLESNGVVQCAGRVIRFFGYLHVHENRVPNTTTREVLQVQRSSFNTTRHQIFQCVLLWSPCITSSVHRMMMILADHHPVLLLPVRLF